MSAASEATKQKIIQKMKVRLSAALVEVIDESWKHAGHAGASAGGGHFILYVVSEKFKGVPLLDRNRMVFDVLKDEMHGEIHALVVKPKTPEEASHPDSAV